MSTPKGTRDVKFSLNDMESVHVYSNRERIILQLRKTVATEHDAVDPSFKVAVTLKAADALKIAGELLGAAGVMLERKS
ncbi:MAG TPA: hypothetical protein VN541_08270 [Tepidisphaeraceae bacterium]|nr:hypothetical protein [Tepidisphaeraceae bacterium]